MDGGAAEEEEGQTLEEEEEVSGSGEKRFVGEAVTRTGEEGRGF